MSKHTVIRAVRETFFGPSGEALPPKSIRIHPDGKGAGAIGSVLKTLHDASITEPMPCHFESLLAKLEESERRQS